MTVRKEGFDELRAALQRAQDEVVERGKKVVGQGCNNIKKGAKRRVTGYAHLPHYPHTITYDVRAHGTRVEGEVGPDKSKGGQAHLGNIVEYGTVNNAPIPHLAPELDIEAPKFERYVAELGEKLLRE